MTVDELIEHLETMREHVGGGALILAGPRPFKGRVKLVEAEPREPGRLDRVVLW